jgi:aspartate aminotransferase
VGDWFRRIFNIDFTNEEIQISSGGRPIIYTIFKTLVNPGDKVIYTVPSWNNNHYTHMNDGEHCIVNVTPENNFMPTEADIAPHIKGAALLCLCSPQNPTGTTLDKEELIKICKLVLAENQTRGADEKKLYIMFDQMYWTLTYGDTQHYNPINLVPEIKAYSIFVDGISKSFAATGVRVGWALGPKDVIGKIKAFLSHIGAWAPMAEQVATAQFLNNHVAVDTYLVNLKKELQIRLQYIYNRVSSMKNSGLPVDAIAPQAALYLTIKIDFVGYSSSGTVLDSQVAVTNYILSEAKLALVPFNCFGADVSSPWYRVSVGTCQMEDLEQAFNQLETALKRLLK